MAAESYTAKTLTFDGTTITNGVAFTVSRDASELEVYEGDDARLADVFATSVKQMVTVTCRYCADLLAKVGLKKTLTLTGCQRSNADVEGISDTEETFTFTTSAFLKNHSRAYPEINGGASVMQLSFIIPIRDT